MTQGDAMLNEPVQIDTGVNRVFVGIPDALPNDQLIRLQALSLAVGLMKFGGGGDAEVIACAAAYTAFIADGTVPPPAAEGSGT